MNPVRKLYIAWLHIKDKEGVNLMTNNFTRAFAYLFLGGLSHKIKVRLEHVLGSHYFSSEKATVYHMFARIPLYTAVGILLGLQLKNPVTGSLFLGGFLGSLVMFEAFIRVVLHERTEKHPASLFGKLLSLPLELLLR